MSRRGSLLCFALLAAVGAWTPVRAQRTLATEALPDSPGAKLVAGLADEGFGQAAPAQVSTGSIAGSVVDLSQGAIPGATVVLTGRNGVVLRTLEADDRGRFTFGKLAAGSYHVEVTAAGMGTYVSAELNLQAGQAMELSEVALAVGATHADVQVIATETQIAEEQVKEQEQQRALGVLPNFYTSYIWNAAPLNKSQKYRLALHSATDPVTILGVAFIAGMEQAADTYPAYHQGAEGYFKRLGAGYAGSVTARMFDSAILPSLFHQDPRYFWKGRGGKKARTIHALVSAVVTRGDNGRTQPNYSYILGGFIAGGIAQVYHPASDRGVGLLLQNGLLAIAGHAANNVVREFVLRGLTKVPDYKNGEPAPKAAVTATP
jgi:hypothetical protein